MMSVIANPKFETVVRNLKPFGHIGFDSLPDQLVNKSIQNGYIFNILCIGETGIGKSTLMDSLFNTNFDTSISSHNLKEVNLQTNTYELQESNIRLKLTIADTTGYGDQINKKNSFKDILDYVDTQFEAYFQEELKIKRSLVAYQDTRIHVCLYLICPTGHGLKAIDLECMKKLEKKVNIIPIIAKADTFSKQELEHFKKNVINELRQYDVDTYKFPIDDESIWNINNQMNIEIPFAVVGSTQFVQIENKFIRSRVYPWGIVEVENEFHSDFLKLRDMLVRANTEDMREKTHNEHYEIYRSKRLQELGFSQNDYEINNISLKKKYELKISLHNREIQQKEDDIRKSFVTRIKDTESELKITEKKLYDSFEQLKKEYLKEKEKLEENHRQLNEEILEFYKRKAQVVTQYQSYYSLTFGKIKKK